MEHSEQMKRWDSSFQRTGHAVSQSKNGKQRLLNITSGYSQVKSSFRKVVCNFFMSLSTLSDTSRALEGCTCTTPAERPRVFIVVVTSTSPFCWLYAFADADRRLEWSIGFFFFFFRSNYNVKCRPVNIWTCLMELSLFV